MAFYDIFEQLCKERGVTPTQVARDNGLTQQTVSHWKTRGSTPKAQTVQKLANYFGISITCLLGVEEGCVKMPALNVGDTYFDGAVKITHSGVSDGRTSITFEVDDEKMTADELQAFLSVLEKASNRDGVSIEGFALLVDAASKALQRPKTILQSMLAPTEGQGTTPPPDAPKKPTEDGQTG